MIDLPRIIPVLLLKEGGLYKTTQFKDPKYVGDPINAVKVFNEKEVDELIVLDIDATRNQMEPPYELLYQMAGECFLPLCYGGGVRTIEQVRKIISLGVERVAINSMAIIQPDFVKSAADAFGSSTIVVSLDVKLNKKKQYEVFTHGGTRGTGRRPEEVAIEMNRAGAGELLLNSIDRDGMMNGYDLALLKTVVAAVDVPVTISGGAGQLNHLVDAFLLGKASAAAAGSMFVFHGKNRGVLINYPDHNTLLQTFSMLA